jgi:hypothetical protein
MGFGQWSFEHGMILGQVLLHQLRPQLDVAAGERDERWPIRSRSMPAAVLPEGHIPVNERSFDRWEL